MSDMKAVTETPPMPRLSLWQKLRRRLMLLSGRMRLRNRSVTVISNNCWGGFMLKGYNLPFNTPFVGLFMMIPDYVTLLENPSLLDGNLRFIKRSESKWDSVLPPGDYPVGVVGDGLEVHFLHYSSQQEARSKWQRRCRRIDWNNAIVKLSDGDRFDRSCLDRFERLPYPCKVTFTSRSYPGAKTVVEIPEFAGRERVSFCWRWSDRYWDFVSHANAIMNRDSRPDVNR